MNLLFSPAIRQIVSQSSGVLVKQLPFRQSSVTSSLYRNRPIRKELHTSSRRESSKPPTSSASSRIQSLLWTMPKEEKHLKSLRLIKKEKKNRKLFDQPYKIFWQVVGSGGPGAPTSLFLCTDIQGYFFNCGEGTQRMASFVSLQKSLSQTDNVFVTSNCWKNLGGLPGLGLTIRGFGVSEMTVHGPPGCMDLYDATSHFLPLVDFEVKEHKDNVYSDNAVDIQKIVLRGTETARVPAIPPTWNPEEIAAEMGYKSAVQAYIVTFVPRVGKLNVEKCVDAGVPPGPLFGQLKAGKDITLEDGRVVRSVDVLGNNSLVSSSIVLEIPSVEYLDALEGAGKLLESKNLNFVFHFTSPEVASHPRYQAWMSKIGSSVQHVFMNSGSTGTGLMEVTAHQAKLHHVRPDLFPALRGIEEDPDLDFDFKSSLTSKQADLNLVQGKTGLKLHVRPEIDEVLEFDGSLLYDKQAVMDEILKGTEISIEDDRIVYTEELQKDLQYAKSFDLTSTDYQAKLSLDPAYKVYPEITFLGTGSAIPSKYRNVSCIIMESQRDTYLVLDCGEGSLSQLYRLHGQEKAEQVLMGIRTIYISHQHADHQLGTTNFILAREEAFRKAGKPIEKLYIVSTAKYGDFLKTYHTKMQPVLSNTELVACEELVYYSPRDEDFRPLPGDKSQLIDPDQLTQFLQYSGLSAIETCRALHCPHAFCMSLRTEAGYKLTYTGDTRPTPQLVTLGQDSDLLIHEATMEQGMLDDAIIKKHSTFTEAIQDGKDMGAKFTLLTHFSQRYSKIPLLDEIEGQDNVGIAFDNLVVNPETMKNIPATYPAFKRIFWSEVQEMRDKSDLLQYNKSSTHLREEGEVIGRKEEIIYGIKKKLEDKEKKFEYINKKKEKMKAREERKRELEKLGKLKHTLIKEGAKKMKLDENKS